MYFNGRPILTPLLAAKPPIIKVSSKPGQAQAHLHLIVDNYRTHTHANVNAWLEKHPRFHLHFIPTSSSWLNLVERWFRELTEKAIRRGVFHSVPDLIQSIETFLQTTNDDPRPFVWTASIESILEKVGRCKAVLATLG